ncbi:GntR family transcriptional regulator [Amycolatopsis aidingensis]|uniref:GntR family transcriptional regulator n=1 Tax=Amycolatopsis aidingensis TaxID=2842453 RepID=UPI001E652B69|nr:GntR family transcriptional regulator [Amycolatopsis aidingensis]
MLQTMSTRDALVEAVRKQILGGELRPGEPLVETALAATFGVARPTVRSALQELVGRNLVQRSQGRSLIVPVLTEADVRDLFFVRTPLELAAVREIVQRRRPLERPGRRLAEMEALPVDAGWADRVEAHTAFHLALVDAAGSARLSRIYPALQEEMQLCLAQLRPSYPRPHDLTEEHRLLLDAVRSGDAEHACAQMEAHLRHAVESFATQH